VRIKGELSIILSARVELYTHIYKPCFSFRFVGQSYGNNWQYNRKYAWTDCQQIKALAAVSFGYKHANFVGNEHKAITVAGRHNGFKRFNFMEVNLIQEAAGAKESRA